MIKRLLLISERVEMWLGKIATWILSFVWPMCALSLGVIAATDARTPLSQILLALLAGVLILISFFHFYLLSVVQEVADRNREADDALQRTLKRITKFPWMRRIAIGLAAFGDALAILAIGTGFEVLVTRAASGEGEILPHLATAWAFVVSLAAAYASNVSLFVAITALNGSTAIAASFFRRRHVFDFAIAICLMLLGSWFPHFKN